MSGFSSEWLALREPYDQAARSRSVLDAAGTMFAGAPSVAVTDLGCGTGATLRAITDVLPKPQRWRLIDQDEVLLARAREATRAEGVTVETAAVDLARHLESAVGDAPDLVATSALLDLVSADWLDRLVATIARLQCPFYAALSFDGRVVLAPAAPDDDTIIAAVNRHQLTDKSFGPALGPSAAIAAPQRFRDFGFDVVTDRSDWRFAPADREIQSATLDGWAVAAREIGVASSVVSAWLEARRTHLAAGRSEMTIGHVDFLARPIGRR